MKILNAILGATAVAAVLLFSATAGAQSYPDRTITMVVPFSAGGPTDTVARLVAESMSKDLGQQVIVENVGGAGGTLGAARVANAEADGYTATKHQREVGTGYFDRVRDAITGGQSSTGAMAGSTETAQFH